MSTDVIERLSELQIRRPWVLLVCMALVTSVFAFFASRLDLETRYDALLPGNQPSVRELHRVEARTASAQTLFVLLEGPDRAVLRAMGDALVPLVLALGPDTVSTAADGTREGRSFLSPALGSSSNPPSSRSSMTTWTPAGTTR